MFYLLWLGLLGLSSFYLKSASSHPVKCSYQHPDIDDVVLGVVLEDDNEAAKIRKRSLHNKNLRIKLHFDSSISKLSDTEQSFVRKGLLPDAVTFWEQALRLRRPTLAPIRLNRKCNSHYYSSKYDRRRSCADSCKTVTECGEVVVPDEHLLQCRYCRTGYTSSCGVSGPPDGPGVADADFLLYVSAVQSEKCTNVDTVAYAAHCQQEADLDRPIAGHVNLCPGAVSSEPRDQEVLSSTVKHEILHALGFSAGLYAFYRDTYTGQPLTERNGHGRPKELDSKKGYYKWSERTIKQINRTRWWTRTGYVNHTVWVMVTPRVRAEASYHFGCLKLEGAELENQGSEGTVLTHWEKRLFENEAMTGTHTQNPVYSRLTLALMEDTGWYKPNYSMSEQLHWGQNLGCDFAMKSCGEWIKKRREKKRSIAPFCDQVKGFWEHSSATTTCTLNRDSVALCNLLKYDTALPREYQEFEWKNDSISPRRRDSRCEFEENTPIGVQNAALETYGEKSKCFHHYKKWAQRRCGYTRTFQHYGAGCYEYHCVDGRLWLDLLNGTQVYPCYHEGQKINIRRIGSGWLHEGIVLCPSCIDFCQTKDSSFRCSAEMQPSRPVGDPVIAEPCRSSTCLLLGWQLLFFVFLLLVLTY